jgi:membrane-associated protease RseP (regulator of RpoE activity)
MRGVDLDVFDFDYDLTWAAFFLSPEERVYGRYGGRDAESADGRTSLTGLRNALAAALRAHRAPPADSAPRPTRAVRTADQYPAARRRPDGACIHCHQVYDFRREALQTEGRWRLDDLWVYPLPENVGLTLDLDEGDRVRGVAEGSPAARAGLRAGDRLRGVNGVAVASSSDAQYGLHRAPAAGAVPVTWLRDGRRMEGTLSLAEGWRQTDISWRWSLRGLEPDSWVQGPELSQAEKRRLGLSEHHLAFCQSGFLSAPARQAGIRPNDVIIGIDGKRLELTARQFQAYVKLHYRVGDRVTYNVLRDGKHLDVTLSLTRRPPF